MYLFCIDFAPAICTQTSLCGTPVEAASYLRIQRAQFRQQVSSTAALQHCSLICCRLRSCGPHCSLCRGVLQPHRNRSRVTTETAGRHRLMSSAEGYIAVPSTYPAPTPTCLLSSPCFFLAWPPVTGSLFFVTPV